MTLAFYCLSALDVLDSFSGSKISEEEQAQWKEWIWQQHISGELGAGFRPGPSVSINEGTQVATELDQPHLIMTYTAIVSLCILRDDLSKLDRLGIVKLLGSSQLNDGSFTPSPRWGESDVRLVYCAFVISYLLDDWSGVDVRKAVNFVRSCRTYEGGYGQSTKQEAQGGTTYCSVAALALAPTQYEACLSPNEREETIRWLIQRQIGGFQGRTEKTQDACYSFWCGAALNILGTGDLIDANANAEFISKCQFKYGGIAKFPEERPDPFHTYLALASLSLSPPSGDVKAASDATWIVQELHPVINARTETAEWAMRNVKKRE